MKVIAPITVTNSVLLSSNVTEDDHAEWDISTTYADGDRVIVIGTTHKVYESAAGANLGNDPVTDDGTWWTEISATNRWKAFDRKISDQVSRSGTITYSFTVPSLVTCIAFLNLEAAQVRVQVYDLASPAVETFDETRSLVDDTEVIDWFTFFTWDPSTAFDSEAIFVSLAAYAGYQVDITIGDGSGTAKVGQIVLGRLHELGQSLEGTSTGIEDFSRKDRDDFGNAILVERGFADTTDFQFSCPTGGVRRVKRILSDLRATPAVYFTDEAEIRKGTLVYGFFRDFDIPLTTTRSLITLEIEGLT